jgi:hypothetical protein
MSLLLLFHPGVSSAGTTASADFSSNGAASVTLTAQSIAVADLSIDGASTFTLAGAATATADISAAALAQLTAEGAALSAADFASDGVADVTMEGASIGGTQVGDMSADGVADVQFEGIAIEQTAEVTGPVSSDFAPITSYGGPGWVRGFPATMPQHRPQADDEILDIIKRMASRVAHEVRMRRYA